MVIKDLKKILRDALDGDLRSFNLLMQSSDSELSKVAESIGDLILKKEALKAVLEAWRLGRVSESEVQLWASFAKRGYVPPISRSFRGFIISYDAQFEDLIATIVARLEELGDDIDGTISGSEREGMILAIRSATDSDKPALTQVLREAVDGDLVSFYLLIRKSDSELSEVAESAGDLILKKEALEAVLEAWKLGQASESDVHLWSLFVKRGYVPRSPGFKGFVIDYDEQFEGLIATIVARLEKLGDSVDGTISASEREEMILAIRSARSESQAK